MLPQLQGFLWGSQTKSEVLKIVKEKGDEQYCSTYSQREAGVTTADVLTAVQRSEGRQTLVTLTHLSAAGGTAGSQKDDANKRQYYFSSVP